MEMVRKMCTNIMTFAGISALSLKVILLNLVVCMKIEKTRKIIKKIIEY